MIPLREDISLLLEYAVFMALRACVFVECTSEHASAQLYHDDLCAKISLCNKGMLFFSQHVLCLVCHIHVSMPCGHV